VPFFSLWSGLTRFSPRQHSLKQEEVEELQAAFNLFSNKKKELDGEDLKSVMRQLDMPASQQVVDAMMKEASKSGSGKVSKAANGDERS
jgi:Ca2+-binding EF-hand superfamily protein